MNLTNRLCSKMNDWTPVLLYGAIDRAYFCATRLITDVPFRKNTLPGLPAAKRGLKAASL